MNTMNVNGQNGVATSALKNAVVKAVKKIDKAENAIGSYVKINDGIRLYYHGQRFIKGTKDNFIFNAKIERRDVDDRYNNYAVVFKYENLDNEEGLYLDSMVNGIIDAILNATDETIVKKIDAAENGDDWSKQFADNLQNFRNDYFGSRLAVDNADDLDSPDALDIDEDYNLEFLRNRMPVIPIDLIKQGVDEYLDDEYEYRRYCGTGRFECDFEEFADKVWENVWALVLDNDLSDEFIENDTRNYMEFNDRLYYMIDSENINGLFLHNDNVCQNFDDDENDGPDALDNDMTDMTIREYFEKYKVDNGWGTYVTADPINNYVDEFLSPGAVKTFFNLVEKDEDWLFYIDEDADGDLYVSGNEGIYKTYFDDDVPMIQVYSYLIDKMNEEIIKTETEIENEIEGAEYKVLDAFECGGNFDVDYDEWWDYVLGETPDWIKDKYFVKFSDVLFDYFVKFAEDYDYSVQEIDGGISLEMPDYNI